MIRIKYIFESPFMSHRWAVVTGPLPERGKVYHSLLCWSSRGWQTSHMPLRKLLWTLFTFFLLPGLFPHLKTSSVECIVALLKLKNYSTDIYVTFCVCLKCSSEKIEMVNHLTSQLVQYKKNLMKKPHSDTFYTFKKRMENSSGLHPSHRL